LWTFFWRSKKIYSVKGIFFRKGHRSFRGAVSGNIRILVRERFPPPLSGFAVGDVVDSFHLHPEGVEGI